MKNKSPNKKKSKIGTKRILQGILLLFFIIVTSSFVVSATTRYVNNSVSDTCAIGTNYPNITNAISSSTADDTIIICKTSTDYNESITVNKAITLQGNQSDVTIISPNNANTVITLSTAASNISNLIVKNAQGSAVTTGVGVYVNVAGCRLTNITADSNKWNIWLNTGSNYLDNVTSLNSISHGFEIAANSNYITNSRSTNSTNYGFDMGSSRTNITIDNSIAENSTSASFGTGFYCTSCTNVTVKNSISRYNKLDGIKFNLCTNSTAYNNTVQSNAEYGIYTVTGNISNINLNIVWNSSFGIISTNTWYLNIINNTIYNNSDTSYYITNTSNSIIYNNIGHNDQYTTDKNGFIISSGINNNISLNTAYQSYNGLQTSNITLSTINNNTVHNNKYYGLYLSSSSNNTVDGTTAYINNRSGIMLYTNSNYNQLTHSTSYNNYINDTSLVYGIWVYSNSLYNNVSHNTAYGNSQYNILIHDASNYNNVEYNIVWNSTRGIRSSNTSNNVIQSNVAYNHSEYGFSMRDTHNATYYNNTAYGNTLYGMFIQINSTANNYSNNNLSYNQQGGIFIEYDPLNPVNHDETIINNILSFNNLYGLSMSNSDNNTISNNQIYSNGQNGIYLNDSNNTTMNNNIFYNNSISSYRFDSLIRQISYKIQNMTIGSSTGTVDNSTRININDTISIGNSYRLGFMINTQTLPSSVIQVLNKAVNLSTRIGTPSIDSIDILWDESEIVGYNKSLFSLLNYNGTLWRQLNNTPDIINNKLSLTNFAPDVEYILAQDKWLDGSYIKIISPINNILSNNATQLINISNNIADTSLIVYSLNSGSNTTYTTPTYKVFNEGHNTLIACLNNSINYWLCNTTEIDIDTIAPTISIVNPQNVTYGFREILLNISSDGNNIWYNWNGTNYTYTSPINITFNEGGNTLHVWVNDTANNLNSTSIIFTTDTIAPNINIISPINAIYGYSKILLNISSNGDTVIYNWNGTNYTYSSEINITFNEGENTVHTWAEDSVGNINSTQVTLEVDTTSPIITIIKPTNESLMYSSLINISGYSNDTNGISTTKLIINYSNGTEAYSELKSTPLGTFIFTITTLEKGKYYIQIIANDTLNNIGLSNIIEINPYQKGVDTKVLYNDYQIIGIYKQGKCMNLTQICNSCDFSKLGSITKPNSVIDNINSNMTQTADTFSYEYCNTDQTGTYLITGSADPIDNETLWHYKVQVTTRGEILDNSTIANVGLIAIALTIAIFIWLKTSRTFGSIMIMGIGLGAIALSSENGWIGLIILASGFIATLYAIMTTKKRR